ncbi:YHS domain protein [Nocardiopsis aegyptia]|uniref:YHS domain protein n=1 Tax=Nocardiopsis aegyptia TaxID=220378 RepID=UPI00366D8BC3
MMFIELFASPGALDADTRERVAERLGSVWELTEGEGILPEAMAVLGSLVQVVVHEPVTWVGSERALAPDSAPHFMIRVHVPGPWRKAMSDHVVAYTTAILTESVAGSGREPVVHVHVLGVPEGGIGVAGKPVTSDGIVEMMSEPYEQDRADGRAVKDPLCGVTVPLNESAVTLELDGTLYGFCCADCREEFAAKRRRDRARA